MAAKAQMTGLVVHQYHHCLAPGDAVSGHLQFIQRTLAAAGVVGEIFCSINKGVPDKIARPFRPEQLWSADLLLVHHSIGNPDLNEVLRLEVPLALMYHNITPGHFVRHDRHMERLCDLGRTQLKTFSRRARFVFALSEYSAAELRTAGFISPELFPLFDLRDLQSRIASPEVRPAPPAIPRLLFCGRLVPHKNQALLLQALYYLIHSLRQPAHLTLVGSGDPIYESYLKLLVKRLGLTKSVSLPGKLGEKKYFEAYRDADLFVCASLHEGFCIPIVEAMLAGIPVVAAPNAAIGQTMGGAGVEVLTENPRQIAAIWAAILNSPNLREMVLKGQLQRLAALATEQSSHLVAEKLSAAIHTLRHNPH